MNHTHRTDTQQRWATTGHGYQNYHYGPSEWEVMLKDLGISEAAVLDWKCAPADLQRIKQWVRSTYRSRYVPERVLEHMGIYAETSREGSDSFIERGVHVRRP